MEQETSAQKVARQALKHQYGDYAMVLNFKEVKNLQDYQEKITVIFESIRMVQRVQVYEIDDSIFVLFDKIKSSQRSWLRLINSITNCFKDIKGDAFIRLRLLKDVHINDDVLISGACIFDEFISNGSLFQKEILANLLWVL